MAKLILVDNYNREAVADKLLEDNLPDDTAIDKAAEYNKNNLHGDWFAKAVSDEYKLWAGIAEFM